jgi:hypothetical protein
MTFLCTVLRNDLYITSLIMIMTVPIATGKEILQKKTSLLCMLAKSSKFIPKYPVINVIGKNMIVTVVNCFIDSFGGRR